MRCVYLTLACFVIVGSQVLHAQEDDTTLPPVTVRPAPRVYQPYSPPYDGPIDWGSDVIQSDTDRVGPYGQPVWTTQRPFATSRVYVLPPGQAQFEQWVRPTWSRGEGKPEFRMLEELAIGLGGGFQLDLYQRWNIEPNEEDEQEANHEGVQVELRYALADWDEIILNPTLYIEWIERGGSQEKPNKYEAKLLLGDEIGCNWFYASNFILEQEVEGDERETELAWTNAISTTIIERRLMAGVEMNWSGTTVKGERSDMSNSFQIGPSLQFRPTNRTFLDVVALFGTTSESPETQLYMIFGYQFGNRAGPTPGMGRPASARGG